MSGSSHVVHFGRIGTAGQTRTKSFASEAAAQADVDKLALEKVNKGYSEIGGKGLRVAATNASARRVTLTARDRSIVLTLAANRFATNDVVQELASIADAKEHFERVLMLRRKEGYAITRDENVADDAAEFPAADDTLEFKTELGRWLVVFKGDDRASPQQCDKVIARLVKDAPKAAQLVCDFAFPGDDWAKRIAGKSLPSLSAFIFDTYFQTVSRQYKNSIGDLAATLRACPNVERLFVTGDLELSKVTHASLKEAYFLGSPLSEEFLKGVSACHFPALERLVISFENNDAPQNHAAVLTAIDAPFLRHFHAPHLDEVTLFLAALADAGIPASLRTLVLGGGIEDEDDFFALLEKHASQFRALDAFAAPFSDCVSSETEEKIRALFPNAKDISEFHEDTVPAAYQDWV